MNNSPIRLNILHAGAYVIKGEAGAILVDTGPPGHEKRLESQLKNHGLALHDIHTVILTHAHYDHAGNLKYVKEKAAPLSSPILTPHPSSRRGSPLLPAEAMLCSDAFSPSLNRFSAGSGPIPVSLLTSSSMKGWTSVLTAWTAKSCTPPATPAVPSLLFLKAVKRLSGTLFSTSWAEYTPPSSMIKQPFFKAGKNSSRPDALPSIPPTAALCLGTSWKNLTKKRQASQYNPPPFFLEQRFE